jgi:hypothetical protein
LPLASEIFLTEIDADFEGDDDADIPAGEWREVARCRRRPGKRAALCVRASVALPAARACNAATDPN